MFSNILPICNLISNPVKWFNSPQVSGWSGGLEENVRARGSFELIQPPEWKKILTLSLSLNPNFRRSCSLQTQVFFGVMDTVFNSLLLFNVLS